MYEKTVFFLSECTRKRRKWLYGAKYKAPLRDRNHAVCTNIVCYALLSGQVRFRFSNFVDLRGDNAMIIYIIARR